MISLFFLKKVCFYHISKLKILFDLEMEKSNNNNNDLKNILGGQVSIKWLLRFWNTLYKNTTINNSRILHLTVFMAFFHFSYLEQDSHIFCILQSYIFNILNYVSFCIACFVTFENLNTIRTEGLKKWLPFQEFCSFVKVQQQQPFLQVCFCQKKSLKNFNSFMFQNAHKNMEQRKWNKVLLRTIHRSINTYISLMGSISEILLV